MLLLLLVGLFVVVFLVEVALFWASTALGSVEVKTGKLLVGALLAAVAWVGASYAVVAFLHRPSQPLLSPENRLPLILASLAALVVSWAVPAVLFVPILPVSVPRGMLVSVFQLLLRLFLYTLVGAVIMVVLAVLQIRSGPSKPPTAEPASAVLGPALS
jgi:hypothetical protein